VIYRVYQVTWGTLNYRKVYIMENVKVCTNKSIGKWISVIYRRYQMEITRELKYLNLSSSQYIYLVQLYKGDHVTQDWLAKELHLDKSSTARAVKQLEVKGYIEKKANPDDKRSQFICLTKEAHSIKKELFAVLDGWNEKMTAKLSDQEYELLYDMLKEIAEEVV